MVDPPRFTAFSCFSEEALPSAHLELHRTGFNRCEGSLFPSAVVSTRSRQTPFILVNPHSLCRICRFCRRSFNVSWASARRQSEDREKGLDPQGICSQFFVRRGQRRGRCVSARCITGAGGFLGVDDRKKGRHLDQGSCSHRGSGGRETR